MGGGEGDLTKIIHGRLLILFCIAGIIGTAVTPGGSVHPHKDRFRCLEPEFHLTSSLDFQHCNLKSLLKKVFRKPANNPQPRRSFTSIKHLPLCQTSEQSSSTGTSTTPIRKWIGTRGRSGIGSRTRATSHPKKCPSGMTPKTGFER